MEALPNSDTLSSTERSFALAQLNASRTRVLAALEGLTPEQLNFRPDSQSWSIAEVAEHIALAETGIFSIVTQQLQTAPNPEGRQNIQVSDTEIFGRLTNRKGKVSSPEVLVPTGRFANVSQTTGFFIQNRAETIRFISETPEDLRNRYWKHPATGVIDLYQAILVLSGHSERHVLQILEIKQHPNFPQ